MAASRWRAGAAVFLLGFIAFLPAVRAGFLWDDISIYLLENPLLRESDGLFRMWFTRQPVDFYPLTNSLHWFEWRLFPSPAGYHVVQLLLHALTSVLLWRALVGLQVPGAWPAAALFAVHPLNTETAAWISQTKNTLSFGLLLASLIAYLRFERTQRRAAWAVSFALFVFAILAKTSAVVLPALLLVCAWWQRRSVTRVDLQRILPYVGAGIVLGLVAMSFQSRTEGAIEAVAEPFTTRLAAAGWIPWFYLYKTFVPIGLTLVYPRWEIDPGSVMAWLPGLALLVVLAIAWRARSGWGRPVLVAAGWFLLQLAPVLGFVGIGFMAHARVTDHWCYAAIPAPLALVAGWLAHRTAKRGVGAGARVVLAALPVLLCLVLSWRQASLYVDEERLWRDTLAKNPRAWVAHNNLGRLYAVRGQVREAESELQAAVRLAPRYGDALLNLANVLDEQGRTTEAFAMYARALEAIPYRPDLHFNLGVAFEKQGKLDEAAAHYSKALELHPLDGEARARLAAVQTRRATP